jgi:hypothetical protein
LFLALPSFRKEGKRKFMRRFAGMTGGYKKPARREIPLRR